MFYGTRKSKYNSNNVCVEVRRDKKGYQHLSDNNTITFMIVMYIT